MLSFAADIKNLFRAKDVSSMRPRGLNLWKYEDVRDRADDILKRVKDGSMPCDGRWSQERIYKFKTWIDEGKAL